VKHKRQEFTGLQRIAIVSRARDTDGKIRCEACGIWVKSPLDWEIHHKVEERAQIGVRRKLTVEDGILLCLVCHAGETIIGTEIAAKVTRLQARAHGIKIKRAKTARPLKVAAGQTELQRRYGITGDEP
jgi:hypothetical protein